jgi:hypothetical protein
MIHNWKRQLQEGASDIFEQQNRAVEIGSEAEAEMAQLYRQSGQ